MKNKQVLFISIALFLFVVAPTPCLCRNEHSNENTDQFILKCIKANCPIGSLKISANDQYFVTTFKKPGLLSKNVCYSEGEINLWSLKTFEKINGWKPTERTIYSFSNADVTFDGSLAGMGICIPSSKEDKNDETYIKIWRVPTGEKFLDKFLGYGSGTLLGGSKHIHSFTFSPSATLLLTGDNQGTIEIWNTINLQKIKTIKGHDKGINAIVFSNNGKLFASASKDNTIIVWDSERLLKIVRLSLHAKAINLLAFNPDDNLLASAADDNTIIIWDVETGNQIAKLEGHNKAVTTVDFSNDGKYLISGGRDGQLIVWDAINYKELLKLFHPKGINAAQFNSNSNLLVSACDDSYIRIWDFKRIRDKIIETERLLVNKREEELRRLTEAKEREDLLKRTLPAELITNVEFIDHNSLFPNNTMDASEEAFLHLVVTNKGKGIAFDVNLRIMSDNDDIVLPQDNLLNDINPAESKDIKISIKASLNATDGVVQVNIETNEKRGYDARPIQLQIPIRHLDKPALAFASFTLNDGTSGLANGNGNGIAENGETVEVSAFVKNSGVGPALNTVLSLSSVSSGAEIRQGIVRLGTVAPEETKQGKVVVSIPRTFAGTELRCAFTARDTIGASVVSQEHVLAMSRLAPALAFDHRFLDSGGVQVEEVSNGGNYVLEIVPRNEGQMAGRGVQAKVVASNGIVMTTTSAIVGDLAAGATAAAVRFGFVLPRNYNAGSPQFALHLSQSEFAELSQNLQVPLRLKAPKLLAQVLVNTSDGNAEIQQGETVDIDLVVENQGDLDAEAVAAALDFSHTGIDFRERSKPLGRIPAGGQQRARFSLLVKTGAAIGPLVGQLHIRQADGFPAIDQMLSYAINVLSAQVVTVTPTDQAGAGQRAPTVVRANTPPAVFLSLKNLGADGKAYEPFATLEIQFQDDKPMLSAEPEIRVNGKLQTKEQGLRGLGLQERESKEIDRKIRLVRRVELNEGANDIEVRVWDSDNEMGLENTQVEYQTQRTDIWAIVVGVGEYQNSRIEELKYAAADAQSFYDFLRSPEGGSMQSDHLRLLLNREATRENILRDMDWITSRAFENDLVIIYLAMHGEVDQGELYFLGHNSDPHNLLATGIKKSDLEDLLQRRMKSKKVVWFADACHSGSLGEDPQIAMRANRASATNRLLSEIAKARNGLAFFMSAQGTEFSQESSKWGGGHGVFTHFLLQGLRGAADRNQDHFVGVLELYDYVSRQVSEATDGKQNPVLRGEFDRELKVSAVK